MKQFTVIKTIRLSKNEKHYLDVLENTYSIKVSSFIRDAIVEKLRRDIPELRKKYKEKDEFKCPF